MNSEDIHRETLEEEATHITDEAPAAYHRLAR